MFTLFYCGSEVAFADTHEEIQRIREEEFGLWEDRDFSIVEYEEED